MVRRGWKAMRRLKIWHVPVQSASDAR